MPRTVNVNYVTKEVKILLHDSETESLAAATAIAAAESAQEAKDVVVDNLQDSLDAIDAKTETEKTELNDYTEAKKTEITTLGQGYVDSASQKVDEANTILAAIRNEYGYPFTAATAADMTDTTKIYVYTGSETGYTNGDWYYYNGSAWVSGGVYNATAFDTDPTLTISGAAADAKPTGTLLGDLYTSYDIPKYNVQSGLTISNSGTVMSNADRTVYTYEVNQGLVLFLRLDNNDVLAPHKTVYVFKDGDSNVVGSTVSGDIAEYVKVPQNAVKLLVAQLTTTRCLSGMFLEPPPCGLDRMIAIAR